MAEEEAAWKMSEARRGLELCVLFDGEHSAPGLRVEPHELVVGVSTQSCSRQYEAGC